MEEQKKDQEKRIRRTYSKEDFLGLSRKEQKKLAEKYWNGSGGSIRFKEDGMFQFSYTLFSKLCEQLQFRRGIIDDLEAEETHVPCKTIWIDRGKRRDTEIKKLTFSKSTVQKMERFLGKNLTAMERSKVMDALISETLDQAIEDRAAGRLTVEYSPTERQRLL